MLTQSDVSFFLQRHAPTWWDRDCFETVDKLDCLNYMDAILIAQKMVVGRWRIQEFRPQETELGVRLGLDFWSLVATYDSSELVIII